MRKLGKHIITEVLFVNNQVIFTCNNMKCEIATPSTAIQILSNSDKKEFIFINGIGEITAHVHRQTFVNISSNC